MGMGVRWKRSLRFHVLILGQHSFSISATFFFFFLQQSHSSPPFVVTSSYHFQISWKEMRQHTLITTILCYFDDNICKRTSAMKTTHKRQIGSLSPEEATATELQQQWVKVSPWELGVRYQEETHCGWACYFPSEPGENEHFASCGSQITPSTSLTFSP